MRRRQRTIAREIACEGVGLFEGQPVKMVLKPAPPDHGVVFVRTDLAGRPSVRACTDNVARTERRTGLAEGPAAVYTVEHLLAALFGLQVDNLVVELDGPEPPVLDGSAAPFVELLWQAGSIGQPVLRRRLQIEDAVTVGCERSSVSAGPVDDEALTLSYALDYGKEHVPAQTVTLRLTPDAFREKLGGARTFLLEEEIAYFRARGLGGGATLENTIVVGPGSDPGRLRFPDELARHKLVDLLGDLSLVEADLAGRVTAVRSGHALNLSLAKELRRLMTEKITASKPPAALDIRDILRFLPHRYPFLLVDRILELEDGKRAVGVKNVTFNEHFFQGHFPGRPMMPGVLQIEAMAQLGGVLLMKQLAEGNKLAVLLAIDGVKFRRQVVPGDTLLLEANAVKVKTRTGQVNCTASVDGQLAAEAQIKFMLVDFNEQEDVPEES